MKEQLRVLMVGPARSVHGGISGVVNNYYEAGLSQKVALKYIGTMVEGSKVKKLFVAIKALIEYLVVLPKYDLVHIHMASDNSYKRKSYFIKAAKLFHKKIVLHQHGGNFDHYYLEEQDEKGKEAIRKVLNMADTLVILSPHWRPFFAQLVNPDRIQVLPNAIPLPAPYTKEYGQRRLLFLGRICKEKGIRELFAAIEVLREEFPDMRLSLGGIWEEDLKEQAKALGEHVEYLGWITGEEKQRLLQESDIFVLPTYFEGLPVSLLEAMANYCGVIATTTGGIPHMMTSQVEGILIPPKDVDSLTQAIRQLLLEPKLCKQYGDLARKQVETHYSMEENQKKLLSIYETVSQRNGI